MTYYEGHGATETVNILGTVYSVYLDVPPGADDILETCGGYCDKTVHRIVVGGRDEDTNLGNFAEYAKLALRHEIIHAFLFESGLGANAIWHVEGQEHPEQMVDWIAMQFPKILKAFQDVGAI